MRMAHNCGLKDELWARVATAALGGRFNPRIASSGATMLVVYDDQRTGDRDIFGTRLTAGSPLSVLDPAGIAITAEPSLQLNPTVAAQGNNFFVAWTDPRSYATTQDDIWAQLVSSGGTLVGANIGATGETRIPFRHSSLSSLPSG